MAVILTWHCILFITRVTIVLDIRCQRADKKRENVRQSGFPPKNWSTIFLRKIADISRQELCCVWRNVIWRSRSKLDYRLLVNVSFVCDEAPVTVTLLRDKNKTICILRPFFVDVCHFLKSTSPKCTIYV